MNNRFKFRIWDKSIRKFGSMGEYGFIYQYGLIHGNVKHPVLDCYYNPDVVIQQFTGLVDKNKKDIYEGDVIKYYQNGVVGNYLLENVKYFIAEIVWHNCQYHIVRRNFQFPEGEYDTSDPLYNSLTSHIEVIGNIFENEDLLKV